MPNLNKRGLHPQQKHQQQQQQQQQRRAPSASATRGSGYGLSRQHNSDPRLAQQGGAAGAQRHRNLPHHGYRGGRSTASAEVHYRLHFLTTGSNFSCLPAFHGPAAAPEPRRDCTPAGPCQRPPTPVRLQRRFPHRPANGIRNPPPWLSSSNALFRSGVPEQARAAGVRRRGAVHLDRAPGACRRSLE